MTTPDADPPDRPTAADVPGTVVLPPGSAEHELDPAAPEAAPPDDGAYAAAMPEDLRSELDAVFRAGALTRTLGITLVDWSPGRSTVRLDPDPAVANIAGSVHGGVLYTLADYAFEVACNSYGRLCVALDVSVHHASAAPLDEPVLAEAVEVSRSARVASYRITATGASGEVRAWYQATAYRTARWHLGEDRWPSTWRATC